MQMLHVGRQGPLSERDRKAREMFAFLEQHRQDRTTWSSILRAEAAQMLAMDGYDIGYEFL
jgi:hypothetical protein